jgi:hypothetical protein
MGSELSREGHVVEACDARRGLVDSVALESAVPQSLPVLQPGQRVLDPCPSATVDRVSASCTGLTHEATLNRRQS